MNEDDMLIEPIMDEIQKTIKDLQKSKDANQRRIHSETLKNLCESAGVFITAYNEAHMFEDHPEDFMPPDFLTALDPEDE